MLRYRGKFISCSASSGVATRTFYPQDEAKGTRQRENMGTEQQIPSGFFVICIFLLQFIYRLY
jgi:hypothetical protein